MVNESRHGFFVAFLVVSLARFLRRILQVESKRDRIFIDKLTFLLVQLSLEVSFRLLEVLRSEARRLH